MLKIIFVSTKTHPLKGVKIIYVFNKKRINQTDSQRVEFLKFGSIRSANLLNVEHQI